MKLKVLSGGTAQAPAPRAQSSSNGGGRGRAEQDPIVRRMQEKFGAEIRTIIDQRERISGTRSREVVTWADSTFSN